MPDDSPEPGVTNPNGVHLDRLNIVYRAIDDPVSDTDIGPSRVCVVSPRDTRLDIDGLTRELERLARGPDEIPRSYVLTQRLGHSSWGADAAAATFLLSVGGQVVGDFLGNGLSRIGRAIRSAMREPPEPRPITEDEAKSWAPIMLAARFDGVNRHELYITRVNLDEANRTATIELASPDAMTYQVELELLDGVIALAEVSRTYL